MTDRELMQQALFTLEGWANHGEWVWPESALEQAKRNTTESIAALRERLAQPEQGPVAWMYDWYDETEDIDGVPIGGIVHDWISKDYDEAHSPTMGCHNIRPLYTTPPQRKPLTDEEIDQIAEQLDETTIGWSTHEFARAIEASHGIKGDT